MGSKIDFLDYKVILKYLGFFTIVLLAGWKGKDLAAISIIGIIIYFCFIKDIFGAIVTWLIWFFVQGFYISQAFLTNQFVSKYLSKPPFILFIIFIFFFQKIPDTFKKSSFLKIWILFLWVALISSLYHGQMPFVLLTVSSFFILYMLLSSKEILPEQQKKILNLFIAVALLQTVVSLFQVLQIIPPATLHMSDGYGGEVVWVAKLDDVASGTFGPDASHLASWYVSMIAVFCLLVWTVTKKSKYLIIAGLSILQFSTVDSKTVMIVMLGMMLYLFYYLNRNKIMFRLTANKLISIFFIVIMLLSGLFVAWNAYYEFSAGKYGNGGRGDLKTVYKQEVSESANTILDHWTDWGKIQGYRYLFDDFIKNPLEVAFGYGLQGYNYNGKMGYIESLDTPIMQMDDSTRSRSGLITTFATCGVLGFVLFFLSLISWYKHNISFKEKTVENATAIALLKIFSIFSLLLAFLYSFELESIPIVAFAGLVAVLFRYSESKAAQTIK